MGKLLKFIFGLILFIIILVLGLTITLAIRLSDSTEIAPDKMDTSISKTTEMVLNTELEKSMHDVASTSNVNFLLDEEALEYLFTSIIDKLKTDDDSKVNVSGVDIDVVDGAYYLEASGKAFFYKTVIRCGLKFIEDNGSFTICLENLKVGKMNLLKLGKLATPFINEKELKKSLEKSKIYCDLDLKNFNVIFTNENVKKMMVETLGDEQAELVEVFSDIFLSDDSILEFNLGKENLLGAILHLQMIKYNSETKGVLPYNYDFVSLKNKTKSLIDNNVYSLEDLQPP